MSNRVSRIQVRETLDKYLAKELADAMYLEICKADDYDRHHMIGMTCAEWKERFEDDFEVVWADDTNAGFGKRGDSVYGTIDDCVICRTDYDGRRYKLWVWCEALHSSSPWVVGGMQEYAKRHN